MNKPRKAVYKKLTSLENHMEGCQWVDNKRVVDALAYVMVSCESVEIIAPHTLL